MLLSTILKKVIRQPDHMIHIVLQQWKLPGYLIGHWEIWLQSQISKFQTHFNDEYFLWNCYQVNAKTPHWSLVNIDPCHHMTLLGHNELMCTTNFLMRFIHMT